jgi:hypothetical protein
VSRLCAPVPQFVAAILLVLQLLKAVKPALPLVRDSNTLQSGDEDISQKRDTPEDLEVTENSAANAVQLAIDLHDEKFKVWQNVAHICLQLRTL